MFLGDEFGKGRMEAEEAEKIEKPPPLWRQTCEASTMDQLWEEKDLVGICVFFYLLQM